MDLRFTRGALREVAKTALGMGTGARGLRTVCERLLTETMFEAPGSSIKYVLVTEKVAKREIAPVYLARGQQHKFYAMLAEEEEEWDRRMGEGSEKGKKADGEGSDEGSEGSFMEYRERTKAAGSR